MQDKKELCNRDKKHGSTGSLSSIWKELCPTTVQQPAASSGDMSCIAEFRVRTEGYIEYKKPKQRDTTTNRFFLSLLLCPVAGIKFHSY